MSRSVWYTGGAGAGRGWRGAVLTTDLVFLAGRAMKTAAQEDGTLF